MADHSLKYPPIKFNSSGRSHRWSSRDEIKPTTDSRHWDLIHFVLALFPRCSLFAQSQSVNQVAGAQKINPRTAAAAASTAGEMVTRWGIYSALGRSSTTLTKVGLFYSEEAAVVEKDLLKIKT